MQVGFGTDDFGEIHELLSETDPAQLATNIATLNNATIEAYLAALEDRQHELEAWLQEKLAGANTSDCDQSCV